MKQALIIIDIQNDYFPGGKMELEGSFEAAGKAAALLAAFREKQLPVVHIQHIAARARATFFLPGTEGAQIHASVAPLDGETVLQKNYPSSFRNTGLLAYLKQHEISHLVIAGMMTHMCIDTTTRAAFDLEFTCQVAHDACATKALTFGGQTVPAAQVQGAYMSALDGSFAAVRSTADIIAEL